MQELISKAKATIPRVDSILEETRRELKLDKRLEKDGNKRFHRHGLIKGFIFSR